MKYKPKSYVVPTIYLLILFIITAAVYFTKKNYEELEAKNEYGNITFVSNGIFNRSIPIINVADFIHHPYGDLDITIARYYYNESDDLDKKTKSIVYYDNTYMPNTGIDYTYADVFDVLAIYEGTIIDVSDDELLGKTVKVRHNNELISVYQGLGTIDVTKGDMVFEGQKIGTSGTSKINKDLGNHLHLEIYKNGSTIDPLICFDKTLGDI